MNTNIDLRAIRGEFKVLEKAIKDHDIIVVYRHVLPDFDALGSQMGLVTWIKDNYPNKEVHFVGERQAHMMPHLFPEPEVLDESWYKEHEKRFLAIAVDTATLKRVSCPAFDYAADLIKVDHHPAEDNYGKYNIVYDQMGAASEIIALFCQSRAKKFKLSQEAARYLFIGIVGDTGRFQYQSTTGMTMRLTASLIDTGIKITTIYGDMYRSEWRTLNLLKFVLNNYKLTDKGVCYYVISDEDQKKLSITLDEGKLHINTFRNVKDVDICASITEDATAGIWRVSLRSAHTKINQVAALYKGGGHDFAAGCELSSLDELPGLIEALGNAKVE